MAAALGRAHLHHGALVFLGDGEEGRLGQRLDELIDHSSLGFVFKIKTLNLNPGNLRTRAVSGRAAPTSRL